MASRENEFYWRIYLFLNEGVPLVSKIIISREVEIHESDLDSLLLQNKDQLKKNHRFNESEIEILYPSDGKTNIDKWNTNLFTGVILTLFRTSLKQNERKQIRNIHNMQKELYANPDEFSLDDETYDDHKTTLEEALSSLAFSTKEKTDLADLITMYTTRPLNAADVLQHIKDIHLPAHTRQQLEIFLKSLPSINEENDVNTNVDVYDDESIDTFVPTDNIAKDKQEMSGSFPNKDYEGETGGTQPVETKLVDDGSDVHADGETGDRQPADTKDGGSDVHADGKTGDRQPLDTKDDGSDLHADGETGDRKPVDTKDGGSDVQADDDRQRTDTINSSSGVHAEDADKSSHDDAEKDSDEIVDEATRVLTVDETNSFKLQWQDLEQGFIKEKDLTTLAKRKIDNWENAEVKVAVLGRTGVGKSRFINAIRGCESPKDPLYAAVGSVETTSMPKAYPHPKNKCLQLWDLPGIGTTTFPRNKYIGDPKIDFFAYDIYLIMASDRFTEDEMFFAKELEKSGKVFLFVRTRVDINLDGVNDVEAEVDKIRKDCERMVGTGTVKSNDVYLISSKSVDHRLLDFGKLLERLVRCLSGLKKEAVMYSLQFNTKKLLAEKADALKSRLIWAGLKSASVAIVPMPGASVAVDQMLISRELEFYRKTLGITDGDLKKLAEKTEKHVDELKREYKLKTFDTFKMTTTDVTKVGMQLGSSLAYIAASEAVESAAKLIPAVGFALGGGISFATTFCFLKSNLSFMVEDARTMMEILLKESGSEILRIN